MVVHEIGNQQAEVTRTLLSDKTFAYPFKEHLIHQVVTAYLARGRAGTKAQKTRSEVRGGGIKPWRQKGTGRARAGTIRSPLWEGGGVTFAAKPRDYSQKVNKKMYRQAMVSILSELVRQDRCILVKKFELNEVKTQSLKKRLNELNALSENTLIVLDKEDQKIGLAARNLIGVDVCEANYLDPVSLVKAKKIILTVDAATQLSERFS